jgi:hypothetical protein
MRVLPPVRILPWVLGLTIFGLIPTATHCNPPGASEAENPADPSAVKKEDLRYDGKPFSYWRNYGRTELKAERRIDFLRAMAAFGLNGYAEEATLAIIELLPGYAEDAFRLAAGEKPSTPDQRVISEAWAAVNKLGPPSTLVLLRNLKHPNAMRFANLVLLDGAFSYRNLSAAVIPALVGLVQSKEGDVSSLALKALAQAVDWGEEKTTASLASILEKESSATGFFKIVAASLTGSDWKSASTILKKLGRRATRMLPAVIDVLAAEATRCEKEIAKQPGRDFQSTSKPRAWPSEWAGYLVDWVGDLGSEARPAIPALVRLFKVVDDGAGVRWNTQAGIVEAFSRIGPAAREALPALREALEDAPGPQLRPGITLAIEQISGGKKQTPKP